jgi:hypothetical protein
LPDAGDCKGWIELVCVVLDSELREQTFDPECGALHFLDGRPPRPAVLDERSSNQKKERFDVHVIREEVRKQRRRQMNTQPTKEQATKK